MTKPRIFVTRIIPEKGLDMVQSLAADYERRGVAGSAAAGL